MYSKLQLLCISFLLAYTFSIGYAAEIGNSSPELQILIDVSGSMKHNDPKNLRIPALKLLINLLPDGTNVGIWLFAEKTRALVKTGVVDKKWKKKALSKIKEIHSSGLFTNIEEAIQQSSKAWFNKPENQARHLILLTDGVVDISEDIMESAESRERILIEQVTELQQAGIKVHTIALSENADTQLLEKIAFDTRGWNETVLSADKLQKVFFKIFKQAVPKDTVPIQGNSFRVDSSIDEFSVLVFKKKGAQVTRLITPDSTEIGFDNQIDNVSWLSDKNYDLVTIKNPMTGKWIIDADMDPDNQVMIVTDLKFKVEEIASHISDQESLDLLAYFSDKHQLISREEFLSLIEISIELINETGEKKEWKMQPVTEKPGLFQKIVEPGIGKGRHTIKIKADGKTFQREYIQSIEVAESLISVDVAANKESRTVTIKLIPDKNVINTKMMNIQASITQAGQGVKNREFINKNGTWELVLEETLEGERKIINFSITARSVKGNALSPDLKPIVVDDSLFFKLKVEPQLDEVEQNLEKKINDQLDEVDEDEDDDIDENNDVNWMKTSVIVVVVNIILIAFGFFLFNFLKKRAANSQAQLLARLE
ncbi:MAG: VWA domain-containing protein [Methylococcaceae bacterium]|nr:VWA domain-containing protein [Methylococcaceae bacterium]